ncbi:HAD hydrolase-like protein [Natronococcus sp.]|uniref:HAD hydrolase-like protein n=1 Tax=Natronococcus sp. TaxID=35747 RepID=UPI003A4DC916
MSTNALEGSVIDLDGTVYPGYRLETDVEMGPTAGMTTALVRSGTDRDAVSASAIEPESVLDSLGEVGSILQP